MVQLHRLILVFAVFVSSISLPVIGQDQSGTAVADPPQDAAAANNEAKSAEAKPAETEAKPESPPAAEPAKDEAAKTEPEKKEEPKAAEPDPKAEKKDESKNGKATKADEKEKESTATEIRHLTLSGTYVDLVQPMGLDATSLLLGSGPTKQKSFYRLCDYLDAMAKEESLKVIVFDLSDANLDMNSAQLDEFARRMKKLKESKKKTIAWLEDASNVHLTIAATCDQVLMADFGGVDMPSVAMESMFYRDAMDLIGVKASVVRAGDFKGAVEPYMNSVMSDHLRSHYLDMLKSINDASVSRLADARGMKLDDVRKLQSQRIHLPKDALAAGLVDKLVPYGSMKSSVDEIVGGETKWTTPASKAKKELTFFEFMGMMMAGPSSSTTRIREDSIAVLHLSGPIMDGTSPSGGAIISGPVVKVIEEIGKEERIKAIVVRINSPGGSATASEAIRQALVKLAAKKPTVVSMGEVAASGGYWISCIDVPVYAERGTITGSIGVFSMKLSFGSLMKRIGVHVESLTLDDSAAFFAVDRAWSDEDVAKLQSTIDHVYDRFLGLVAESRGMSVDQAKGLAGGRVWSGAQAKEKGLVDSIGGLDDCLAVVAKKAGLENYKVIHRPRVSAGLNLGELFGQSDEDEVWSSAVSSQAIELLQKRGLRLDTTFAILRDAATRTHHRPTVWLLNPAEISVRE